MKNDEGEVVIPFSGGLVYPLQKIKEQFKSFWLLTLWLSLFNTAASSLAGRTFLCGLGGDAGGFYCSLSIWSVVCSVGAWFLGCAFYISKWFDIGEKKKV